MFADDTNIFRHITSREDALALQSDITRELVHKMATPVSLDKCRVLTFARPHLEYAQSVWAPHLVRNITTLENVSKIRATNLLREVKDRRR